MFPRAPHSPDTRTIATHCTRRMPLPATCPWLSGLVVLLSVTPRLARLVALRLALPLAKPGCRSALSRPPRASLSLQCRTQLIVRLSGLRLRLLLSVAESSASRKRNPEVTLPRHNSTIRSRSRPRMPFAEGRRFAASLHPFRFFLEPWPRLFGGQSPLLLRLLFRLITFVGAHTVSARRLSSSHPLIPPPSFSV